MRADAAVLQRAAEIIEREARYLKQSNTYRSKWCDNATKAYHADMLAVARALWAMEAEMREAEE